MARTSTIRSKPGIREAMVGSYISSLRGDSNTVNIPNKLRTGNFVAPISESDVAVYCRKRGFHYRKRLRGYTLYFRRPPHRQE